MNQSNNIIAAAILVAGGGVTLAVGTVTQAVNYAARIARTSSDGEVMAFFVGGFIILAGLILAGVSVRLRSK